MVEKFFTNCAHPAFGIGIRVRCLWWRVNDAKARGFEHIVKSVCEFAVSIMNQEAKVGVFFFKVPNQLLAYWVTQAESGLAVMPARWTRREPSSMKKKTYRVFNQNVSTVKKSQAMICSL